MALKAARGCDFASPAEGAGFQLQNSDPQSKIVIAANQKMPINRTMLLARPRPLAIRGGSAFAAGAIFLLGLAAGTAVGPVGSRSGAGVVVETSPASHRAAARGSHPAEVLRVIDGDTFDARVHVWPGLDVTTRVRLRGIDAPEIKARCGDEYAKAQSAREALTALLAQGGVQIANIGSDKYDGRVVADASTRTTSDVAQALINAGQVRSYDGGRRDYWCP